MPRRSPMAPPAPEAAMLEVERFGWTAPDRLELHGRWTGVRGLRFVRPTLTLRGSGKVRRALALLEHKPWAAEDGAEWMAAFPWRGEVAEFESAELAVATGIEIALPPPRKRSAKAAARRPSADDGSPPRPPGGVDVASRESAVELNGADETLRAQLAGERAAVQRLANELDRVKTTVASSAKAAERETEQRRLAEAERDAARTARDEAITERDAAYAGRDSARRDRDALETEHRADADARAREVRAVAAARDSAAGRADTLEHELTEAREELARLRGELEAALRAPDALRHELASVAAERDAATHDRDVVRLERDALLSQLERHRSTRS